MRIKLALCLGWGFICLGCGPLCHVAQISIVEPTEYPWRIDDCVDKCRNKKLAEVAWGLYQQDHPDCDYSVDYRIGFLDGYADYLYAGGTGNPPPVPPRWYWRAEFETPDGHRVIEDWFTGFREGALAARHSGYRELVTVPASAALPPYPPPIEPQAPSSAPQGKRQTTSPEQLKTLPQPDPKPVEPGNKTP
jgi:hypothetical protein